MPLTSGNVTIKLSAGTYSSWAAFWDDIGNLTGNITCTVDASAFTENTAPAAVTESLNGYTLRVLPVSFPTTTDASTGARFTCNYGEIFLHMQMEGAGTVIVEGVVSIEGTASPTSHYFISNIDTQFTFTLRRNILKNGINGIYQGDATLDSGTRFYNNIVFGYSNQGITVANDIPNALISNNTVVGGNECFEGGDEEVTFENNLAYGSVSWDWNNIEILTIGNNNADSDGTGEDADWGGGGANNVSNIADPFNDLANDDFTITTEGVIGTAGLDLSGDFTTDFFGVTRSNWTIGACEYITLPLEVSVSECVDTEEYLA